MATIKAADAKVTAKIIKEKIQQLDDQVLEMVQSENTQVKALANRAQIQKQTLEDVLESLQGNHVNLKI